MHFRIRFAGRADSVIVLESKLSKIEDMRLILQQKYEVPPEMQCLLYGGKLLCDGYTIHDYSIKLNDVIQMSVRAKPYPPKGEPSRIEEQIKLDHSSSEEDVTQEKHYNEAQCTHYAVGDLIDMKNSEGAWFEGEIVKIILNPDPPKLDNSDNSDSKANVENQPPQNNQQTKKPQSKKQFEVIKEPNENHLNLLYVVKIGEKLDEETVNCTFDTIRPRARKTIKPSDVKVGQVVMVNYNMDKPRQIGNWYDLKVTKINKTSLTINLVGTLYLGADSIPQDDTSVPISSSKIYAIETVVPLAERNEEYRKMMVTPTEKRPLPLLCLKCKDVESVPCKACGCYICSSKEDPNKILLCDECDLGFHLSCLDPPLSEAPAGDWYCPRCKLDPNEVVAPGAAKQARKDTPSTSRDWGRGMACVGKTKTCLMPANHFGPIPGIEVGMCWRYRIQTSESGVHRPPVSGIHGRDNEGAYSIVLSGGYEDDVDNGNEFTYTGSGGRDLSGNKRTAPQSCDQQLTRCNKALARNCAAYNTSEKGADAGDNWQKGKPVRVVRSAKMIKHFPKYAPKEGLRYDGIYKVVKYYPEKGLSGFRVWKYLLRRDDPSPAPWEEGCKEYSIIYPDGYLEAEAEKATQKKSTKRRRDSSSSEEEEQTKKENKKVKRNHSNHGEEVNTSDSVSDDNKSTKSDKAKSPQRVDSLVTELERECIAKDEKNAKLWQECLNISGNVDRRDFIERVMEIFLCIICQDTAVSPVTTPCRHNFCKPCLKRAFRLNETQCCPCCRYSLANFQIENNEALTEALRTILPGYDAGKKD